MLLYLKKNDPLKENIEKITRKLANKSFPKVDENEKKSILKKTKRKFKKLENDIKELINSLKTAILSCDAKQILDYFSALYSFQLLIL